MAIIYFNKKHTGKIALFLLCALLLTGVCFLISSERKGSVAEYATNDETGRFFTEVSDTPSIIKFFQQFDIEIKPGSELLDEIKIPEKFNVTYKDYNALQKRTGFDLEKYKGVKARRSVYTMKSGGKAVIIVYKGSVIAGHIESGIYGESYRALTDYTQKRKNNGTT